MKGDISRDTFDLNKNYSSVLMQQGRVLLDADWNEQSAIVLDYVRTLAVDLIGQHFGPGNSFAVSLLMDGNNIKNLKIARGRYYVDGIRCDNGEPSDDEKNEKNYILYTDQPYFKVKNFDFPKFPFLVYLDVWERHVTSVEDENLADVALGGIDTTTRTQVVWRVKTLTAHGHNLECRNFSFESNARLIADIPSKKSHDDPCNIEPDAKFRGLENQLYRVEIHRGNLDEIFKPLPIGEKPTFKWSRENGSVVFPIIKLITDNKTTRVWLANLGRDDKLTLYKDDFVEIVDDAYTLENRADKLLRVTNVDRDEMVVTLEGSTTIAVDEDNRNHPFLRRWDHRAENLEEKGLTWNKEYNAIEIIEGDKNMNWMKLEDGIEIQFQKRSEKDPVIYRTGDYWLIPARTATGDIEWATDPTDPERKPLPQAPRGIKHHYAPLAIVGEGDGTVRIKPCRCGIEPHCQDKNADTPQMIKENVKDETLISEKKAVKPAAEKKAAKPKKEKNPN